MGPLLNLTELSGSFFLRIKGFIMEPRITTRHSLSSENAGSLKVLALIIHPSNAFRRNSAKQSSYSCRFPGVDPVVSQTLLKLGITISATDLRAVRFSPCL